jgi:predicted transcriptional regulator of viral defense system
VESQLARSPRYGGHGIALLRALADRSASTFTVDQARAAARSLGIADSYLSLLLHRLQRAGFVDRLKHGAYAFAGSIPGAVDVHAFSIAMALIDPCAVSGWAALNHHGLSEQIPHVITLMTPKRVVTPAMRGASQTAPSVWEVAGQRYEIVSTVPANFFGYEEVWMGGARVRILDRERALLDCFAAPRKFGSLSEVFGILEEHVHEIDVQRLIAHAQRFSKRVVAKRAGYILESLGVAPDVLEPLRALPMLGYRALDPTREAIGTRDRRWQVIVNLDAPRLHH